MIFSKQDCLKQSDRSSKAGRPAPTGRGHSLDTPYFETPHTDCAPVCPIRATVTIDETPTTRATTATTTVAAVRRLSDRPSSQCSTASATATTSSATEK